MKNIPVPTKYQLEAYANRFENHIKQFLVKDLREAGIDVNSRIEFDAFKRWLNRENNLQICYGHKGINIAVSLYSLDEIGINYNVQSYPSFK